MEQYQSRIWTFPHRSCCRNRDSFHTSNRKCDGDPRKPRRFSDSEISKSVQAITIDNMNLEQIGVAWLLFGVLLTTFPEAFVAIFW